MYGKENPVELHQLQVSIINPTHQKDTARLMFIERKGGKSVSFCVQTFQKEKLMLFYKDEETYDSVAVVFEGDEIQMGLMIMEDLVEVMKSRGGTEAPEMQQWLAETKAQFIRPKPTQ